MFDFRKLQMPANGGLYDFRLLQASWPDRRALRLAQQKAEREKEISKIAETIAKRSPLLSDVDNWLKAEKLTEDIEKRAYFYHRLNPRSTKVQNWLAAERDIMQGITSQELESIEHRIRTMIQHENDLLNHRIQWLLTINGFLLAATGAIIGKQGAEVALLIDVFASVGIAICFSFYFSLGIGRKGVGRLADMWEHYRKLFYQNDEPSGCHQIGVLGWRSNPVASKLAPWHSLPFIFSLAWLSVLALTPAPRYGHLKYAAGKSEVTIHELRFARARGFPETGDKNKPWKAPLAG
jgi:hypothetical protein